MSTVIDLRGRHLMKLADFIARGDHLPDRPGGRAEGGQARGPRGAEARRQGDRADLREGLDADALRVRGRRLRPGRARHLHRPRRLAHGPQGDGEGHRPRARPHVRRDRVPRLRPGDRRGARAVGRRPDLQRAHRRVAPDADPRRLPHLPRARARSRSTRSSFCYLGDARFNMADSYLVGGAKLGMDVRIASPKSLWPRDEIVELAATRSAAETRRADHDHRGRRRGRPRRRRAAHRRLGLDGRARRGLDGADRAAHAVPGQRRDDGAHRQPGREVHALPAGVPQHRHARSARRSSRSSGWTRSR